MANGLINFTNTAAVSQRVERELVSLNDEIAETGIVVTPEMAKSLAASRARSLRDSGRFEPGSGALAKIIRLFSASGYLSQSDAEEIFTELLDIFYYVKSETSDAVSDDKLLELMLDFFENKCQGSLELLRSRDLEFLIRRINGGGKPGLDREDDYSAPPEFEGDI